MLYGTDQELSGRVDAHRTAADGLILLDAEHRVLGGFVPGASCRAGRALERLFSFPDGEAAAMELHLRRHTKEALLVQSRETPLLLWNSGMISGGRALALLPPEELRPALAAPLLYLERLPSRLRLSPDSLKAKMKRYEALCRPLTSWLADVQALLLPLPPQLSHAEMLHAIRRRVTWLARHCGVCLDYELGGLGTLPLPEADPDGLVLPLAAAFLLARRVGTRKSVCLFLDREGPDLPVAHVMLRVPQTEGTFPELRGFAEEAMLRGNLWMASRAPEESSLLHIRFTFSRKELSLQEMRNRFAAWDAEASRGEGVTEALR